MRKRDRARDKNFRRKFAKLKQNYIFEILHEVIRSAANPACYIKLLGTESALFALRVRKPKYAIYKLYL